MNVLNERIGPACRPLIAHADLDRPVAYRWGGNGRAEAVPARQFLADVQQLAAQLPPCRHLLNVCTDRYHFAVGLAAALVTGKISLLPSTQTPEMISQLRRFAPDLFYLDDSPEGSLELPRCAYPATAADFQAKNQTEARVPEIPGDQPVAYVFTSGSTGEPRAHRKNWGSLVINAGAEAARLGLNEAPDTVLVGTVPAQHMYGFESTVLLALLSGAAFWAGRPFYPADIAAVLQALPRPRALVSTPYHLRTLLAAGFALPPVELVLSATAPLSANLAVEVEAALQGTLVEIYGCTETGQLASRRTALTPDWQLLDGVRLELRDGQAWASGGHVEQPTALDDLLELQEDGHFRLHGRSADLVNIAGKRTSLGYLNHQLNAIPGVLDGAFFMPEPGAGEAVEQVLRLACFVVAPELDGPRLLQALRQRIDPIFLPRPLHFVAALPRSPSGKLPRQALAALLDGAEAETRP